MRGSTTLEGIKGVILDIDGVLELQGKVYPGAIETVDALRERGMSLRFLTNSTMKSRKSCAERLRKAGFRISDNEVITASFASARYLAEVKAKSCWVLVDGEGKDEFEDFVQDTEDPEYIVIGDNRSRFDFEYLSKALRLLLRGAKLVVMQPELVDMSMGQVELNVGSWAGMLERAARVEAVYLGKPGGYVFELALGTMNLSKDQVVMVGDQPATDIRGANNFGIRSVLVRTGEFNDKDLDSARPDHTVDSIQELLTIF